MDFLKGMAMGIGAIAPGVSGGTLAVIFGLYEKITDAIANLFHEFWKKVKEFFFIGVGGIVGVLGFSHIISYLFKNYELEVKYLFIGLMMGTFPSLRRQANKQGFKYTYLIPFTITLIMAVLFALLNSNAAEGTEGSRIGFLLFVLYGAVIGFGTIIPGISASFILMYLGSYQAMIEGISHIDLSVLIPAGIGFLITVFGFAKLINLLFQKAYGYTYYAVFGLTIGSILSILPGIGLNWRYLIGYGLLVGGFALSYYLSSLNKTHKHRNMVRTERKFKN
jgi:putative membrane protein